MDFLNRFLRKKALPVPGSSSFFVLNGFSSTALKDIKAFANEGYLQNPIVYACISTLQQACSSVKLEVHRVDDAGNVKVETKHAALDLLARPNPTQGWTDFIAEMVAWHRIAGEVFVLRLPEKGPAKEMYLLDPSAVGVEKDKQGSAVPRAYIYGKDPASATRYPVNFLTGESQVLHIKTFNPFDPFRGISPMKAASAAIDTHNFGAQWNAKLLQNGARPSGVVEFEGAAPDTNTLNQLREYFKKAWQGVQNAGNIPLLAGGAKFTPLSHNPKEMDFKDSMAEAAKNIAMVFGVPLPLVTMEAATHSNTEQAEERLWIDTVLPLLNVLISGLSKFIMPTLGGKPNERLAYNSDSVPALEARRERLYKRMGQAVKDGLLKPDEGREEMGFPALGDNADKLLVSSTMTTLDKLGEQPKAVVPPAELVKSLEAMGYRKEDMAQIFGIQEAA